MCQNDTSAWHGPLPQSYQTKKDYFNVLLQSSGDPLLGLPIQRKWTPVMTWMTRHWIRRHHTGGDNIDWSTFPTHEFLDAIGFASRGVGQLDLFLHKKVRHKLKHEFSNMRAAGLLDERGRWTRAAECVLSPDWNGFLKGLDRQTTAPCAADILTIKSETTDTRLQNTDLSSTSELEENGQDNDHLLSLVADLRQLTGSHEATLTHLQEQFSNLQNENRNHVPSTNAHRQRGQEILRELRLLGHDNRDLSAQTSHIQSLLIGALSSIPRGDVDRPSRKWLRRCRQKLMTSPVVARPMRFISRAIILSKWVALLVIVTVVVCMLDLHRLAWVSRWSGSVVWMVSVKLGLLMWWLSLNIVRAGYMFWT